MADVQFHVMKDGWTVMGEGDGQFPLTRLTLLRDLRAASPVKRREALGAFWQSYWKPLHVYARRQGLSNEGAKDLVQSFCARAIEKDLIDRFEPARRRLRTWMLRSFHSFLLDHIKEEHAQKRGGGKEVEPIEMAADVEARSPAALEFDRTWAMGLIERAFARLRERTEIRWPDGWQGKLLARGIERVEEALRLDGGRVEAWILLGLSIGRPKRGDRARHPRQRPRGTSQLGADPRRGPVSVLPRDPLGLRRSRRPRFGECLHVQQPRDPPPAVGPVEGASR